MKSNQHSILRKHIDKNGNVVGIYDITTTEREIFYKEKPVDVQSLTSSESNWLEDLKDSFEDGYNQIEEIDGELYEILRDRTFLIRRKIEEYFKVTQDLFTVNEVANLFGIKADTLRSYITRGEVIPPDKLVKIGRQWFIDSQFAKEKWGNK